MAADEEVTKMKEQLKRAMLLCQQSNKQVLLPEISRATHRIGLQAAAAKAELQTANQTREESDKKAAELVRQNEALQQEVQPSAVSCSDSSAGGAAEVGRRRAGWWL